MARHPAAARVHRPRTDPDDAVVARVVEWSEWGRRNARIVIGVAVVLVLVVLGFLYYRSRSARLDQLAATRLGEIRQTAASGNNPLAIKDLQQFLDRFGGTASAPEGGLLLAQLQLEQTQSTDAISTLRSFTPDDGLTNASRLILLAAAYEQADSTARAVQTYLDVGNNESGFEFQRREGLENAARLQMQNGNPADAANTYQKLLDLTADASPQQTAVYRLRLAEAEAAAQGKTAAAAPAGQGTPND